MFNYPTKYRLTALFLSISIVHFLAGGGSGYSQRRFMQSMVNPKWSESKDLQPRIGGAGVPLHLTAEGRTVNSDPSNVGMSKSLERQVVKQAREDLAGRLAVDIDQIKLLEARAVTWPDASLGCPQQGTVYTQATQGGYLIRLGSGGRMYFYHGGTGRGPFLCEESSRMIPKSDKIDELIPPPEFEID